MKQEDGTLRFIAALVRRYPRRTVRLVLLLGLSGLAESVSIVALLPLLELATGTGASARSPVSRAVEALLASAGLPIRLDAMLVLISAVMVLKGALQLLSTKQIGYTVSRHGTDLRLEFMDGLLRARWGYFIHQPLGQFANTIGAEVMRISLAHKQVFALFAMLVQVVIYTLFALVVSWKIALLALGAGTLMLVVRIPLLKRARAAGRAQNRLLRSISVRLTSALGGIKPLKAMGSEQYLGPLLRDEVEELNRTQERQVLATGVVSATREPILVVLLSIVLYATLSTSAPSFASVLVIAFLFIRLAGQIGQAQTFYQDIAAGEAAFWSLRESIELIGSQAEQRIGLAPPPPLHEAIVLDEVTFGYDDHLVLDRAILVIPARRFVTLVGPSGSGKTTIADLVAGLYAPRGGRILVDGVPLRDVDMAAWRAAIGYVPQDASLFHDTLARNVALGDPAVTREDVEAALEAAGAREFVHRLPEGLDTVVGERGTRLSGGQRQRIAIARALVRRPRLLILDEVTTALDPDTEAAICDSLRELRGRVTVLAISHQAAMTDVADLVYRVERGEIYPQRGPAATLDSLPLRAGSTGSYGAP